MRAVDVKNIAAGARRVGAALISAGVLLGAVHPVIDPRSPASMPFPSDRFSIQDNTQKTHRRINLPLPDCNTRPSDCEDIRVLNTADGFSVESRVYPSHSTGP